MKRFYLVALAALVSVGSAFVAFAEEASPRLEFGGEFLTGARFEADPDEGNTAQLYSDENDEEGIGAVLKLNGTYDADTYGAFLQLKYTDGSAADTNSYPTALVEYSYGWLKFFDGTLTIKAGVVEETSFDNVGDQEIYFFDKGGIVTTWSPLEGLTLGAAVGLEPAHLTNDTPADASTVQDALAFGASYRTDAYVIEAAYSSGDWCTDEESYEKAAAYAQFGVTAIENLQLEADALFIDLSDFSSAGEISVTELVGYTFGKITPSLLCGQIIPMEDTGLTEYTFEPEISYAMNDSFAPFVGGEVTIVESEADYAGKIGFDASLTPSALVSGYYRIASTEMNHAFQIDFIWNF